MMKRIKKYKFLLSTIILLLIILNINAQNQNANWYFGNQAGLNFTDVNQEPNALTDGAMITDGGSASISDSDGNLLFYSNGINVWGPDHKTIKNGTGLYGSTTVSQSVLILPNPSEENVYYVFTNQGQETGSLGLHYSIIKLTNDDDDNDDDNDDDQLEYCNKKKTKVLICHKGKNTICVSVNALQAHLDHGDTLGSCNDNNADDDELEFEVTAKNILLLPTASEKLTAIYNEVDNSYWVVSFAPSNNPAHNDTFFSFKVDSAGVSYVEESTFDFLSMNNDHPGGQMKISSDLKNLGLTHNTLEIGRDGGLDGVENVFTFDFDQVTGVVASKKVHSILRDQNNTIELFSTAQGFDYVHILLNGQKDPINIIASLYGFEFSPDGDKFYISTKEKIEYNTNVVSPYLNVLQVLYRNSQKYDPNYYPIQQIGNEGNTQVYSLQLAMDKKIYGTDNTGNLDKITNPNELSLNAGYAHDAVSLNGKSATKGLPQLIQTNQDDTGSKDSDDKKSVVQGNPFANELIIDIINIQSVEFYNQTGVLVKSVSNTDLYDSDLYSVDTSDLTIGIYFLVIMDEESQVYNETVIKTD